MGGLLVWGSVLVSILLWCRFLEPFVLLGIGVVVGFGLIGFIDDYRKVILRDAKGLRARWKFPFQLLVATVVMLILYDVIGLSRILAVPFFKGLTPDLGWVAIPFAVLVVVGASNAVNLTDGLDGLVSGRRSAGRVSLVQLAPRIDLHGGCGLAPARSTVGICGGRDEK